MCTGAVLIPDGKKEIGRKRNREAETDKKSQILQELKSHFREYYYLDEYEIFLFMEPVADSESVLLDFFITESRLVLCASQTESSKIN